MNMSEDEAVIELAQRFLDARNEEAEAQRALWTARARRHRLEASLARQLEKSGRAELRIDHLTLRPSKRTRAVRYADNLTPEDLEKCGLKRFVRPSVSWLALGAYLSTFKSEVTLADTHPSLVGKYLLVDQYRVHGGDDQRIDAVDPAADQVGCLMSIFDGVPIDVLAASMGTSESAARRVLRSAASAAPLLLCNSCYSMTPAALSCRDCVALICLRCDACNCTVVQRFDCPGCGATLRTQFAHVSLDEDVECCADCSSMSFCEHCHTPMDPNSLEPRCDACDTSYLQCDSCSERFYADELEEDDDARLLCPGCYDAEQEDVEPEVGDDPADDYDYDPWDDD